VTDWTTITDSQVDPDAPITSGLGYSWRDNPIAIAEGSANAPVLSTGWHPYDKVTVGDTADGLFYDFDVDGAVATITSPTFADGYDYMVRWYNLSHNSGSAQNFRIDGTNIGATVLNSGAGSGWAEILAPTLTDWPKVIRGYSRAGSPTGSSADILILSSNFATPLTGITISWGGGNNDQGKAYLYRRRNFMFG